MIPVIHPSRPESEGGKDFLVSSESTAISGAYTHFHGTAKTRLLDRIIASRILRQSIGQTRQFLFDVRGHGQLLFWQIAKTICRCPGIAKHYS
jgi:hypothetical protein